VLVSCIVLSAVNSWVLLVQATGGVAGNARHGFAEKTEGKRVTMESASIRDGFTSAANYFVEVVARSRRRLGSSGVR